MLGILTSKFAIDCSEGGFLGLVPWFKYIKVESNCSIREFNVLPKDGHASDIPFVLLAVIDNLIRLAGLIAVIFVVYGAIMYATSQGAPEQTSKAQSTIINALIGLVIAIIAVVFVNFIGKRLG